MDGVPVPPKLAAWGTRSRTDWTLAPPLIENLARGPDPATAYGVISLWCLLQTGGRWSWQINLLLCVLRTRRVICQRQLSMKLELVTRSWSQSSCLLPQGVKGTDFASLEEGLCPAHAKILVIKYRPTALFPKDNERVASASKLKGTRRFVLRIQGVRYIVTLRASSASSRSIGDRHSCLL